MNLFEQFILNLGICGGIGSLFVLWFMADYIQKLEEKIKKLEKKVKTK